MKLFCVLALLSSLTAFAEHWKVPHKRRPSSSPALTAIVAKSESDGTGALCPDDAVGEPCQVTWQEAVTYCSERGSHLPTARDYTNALRKLGVETIDAKKVSGPLPEGYDPKVVDCLDPDGSRYAFYLNHQGYKRPAALTQFHRLWTASVPPDHQDYAHVFYDEWGGGGGDPKEHKKSYRNAFQCAPN